MHWPRATIFGLLESENWCLLVRRASAFQNSYVILIPFCDVKDATTLGLNWTSVLGLDQYFEDELVKGPMILKV